MMELRKVPVSGAAHHGQLRDAPTGIPFFYSVEKSPAAANAADFERPLSAVARAAFWAGFTRDLRNLHSSALVLKPEEAYTARVGELRKTGEPVAGAGVWRRRSAMRSADGLNQLN